MKRQETILHEMNQLGKRRNSFAFLIDFQATKPHVFDLAHSSEKILWQIPGHSNVPSVQNSAKLNKWKMSPVSFETYEKGFNLVKQRIYSGDTYLLNFTQPTIIETNVSLEDIFYLSEARYKILLKNKFVCFSPETFVKIEKGKIFSFPMKGTIDADIENAEKIILNDSKELAEHNTIVDLIRNDLSMVAENVVVEKFRYLDRIDTNHKNLFQVSSRISGDLPENYTENIGNIIFALLPAGSVTGAPKKKTVEIITENEKYKRGYYTGIFGIFDGENLDSCVLIRYIENQQ
ncbi:MAG TPA: aminodeoxychorismate synthase component I, partial [Draconibacterium sp.]|nr:aminodeoxychorismate synthase component I [Draconibacterium sp.]